jgi:hypothetical protein
MSSLGGSLADELDDDELDDDELDDELELEPYTTLRGCMGRLRQI